MEKFEEEKVVAAFKAAGGSVQQPMALKLELESQGVTVSDAVNLVEQALSSGVLSWTQMGGLTLRANLR